MHAEGRTFVFDEVELKPVRDEYDGLSQSHVGFHPYLEGLIEDQQQNDKECEFFPFMTLVLDRANLLKKSVLDKKIVCGFRLFVFPKKYLPLMAEFAIL